MSDVKTIAKLVAHLGFTVEDKQLDNFVAKIKAATAELKQLRAEAVSKINFQFSVNKSDLIQSKKTLATLGDVKIRLKDIEPSPAKMANVRKEIALAAGKAQVRLIDISLSETAKRKIRQDIKDSIKVGGITAPAKIDTREIGKKLREWLKTRQRQFTFRLGVSINHHNLYTNLKAAVDAAAAKVKTIKLNDPKIQMGIDKPYLRQEIRAALAQIRREVKIKIDLTGRADVSGQPSGGGGRVFGSRHGAIAGGVAGMAASWGRGFIPGLGGAFAISQLNRQVQEFESQQQAAAAVSGSQEAGTATLARLRDMGNTIGFDYRSQAMPFLRMISSGTNAGMEQGEVETVFGNMAKYGRVMGLDDESMKGSMRAVEQMLNKQQVYSEELKTQLAERMPGVISAMAEAVTGDAKDTATLFKKMEAGEVKSTEVMLKFSQILERRAMAGGALQRAMESTAAEQARFRNAWNDFVKEFGEQGFSRAMADFFREAAMLFESLTENAGKAAKAFRILMTPVIALMRIFRNIDFAKIADSLGLTTGQLQTMAMVVTGLLFPWTRMLTIVGLVVTAIDDLMTWHRGGDSLFGRWFEGLTPEKQAALSSIGISFGELSDSFGKLVENVGKLGDGFWDWLDDNGVVDAVLSDIDLLIQRLERIISAANSLIEKPEEFLTQNTSQLAMDIATSAGPGALLRSLYNFVNNESSQGKEDLETGLGYMKQNEMTFNGRKVTAPVGETSVRIDFHMTADEIIRRVGDGSLPDHLDELVRNGTKKWIARELGGAGARLVDYGD